MQMQIVILARTREKGEKTKNGALKSAVTSRVMNSRKGLRFMERNYTLHHVPATTAFDALEADGRNKILTRGANIFMPNLTPGKYRIFYQLYPNKPCVDEDGAACAMCVRGRLASLNRPLGAGPGHSILNKVMSS